MFQPFPGMEPDGKDNGAQAPVSEHANPHGNGTEAPDTAEVNAQADTAEPHGAAGSNHGKFHIPGGTHAVCRDKGKHPGNRLGNRDENNHVETKFRTFRFHTSEHGNRFRERKDNETACNNDDFRQPGKLLYVVNGFVFSARSQALPHNGHQSDADAHGSHTV